MKTDSTRNESLGEMPAQRGSQRKMTELGEAAYLAYRRCLAYRADRSRKRAATSGHRSQTASAVPIANAVVSAPPFSEAPNWDDLSSRDRSAWCWAARAVSLLWEEDK